MEAYDGFEPMLRVDHQPIMLLIDDADGLDEGTWEVLRAVALRHPGHVGAVWCGIACFAPSIYAGGAFNLYAVSCIVAVAGSVYYWPKTPNFWMQDVWWETETAREGMGMWFLGLSLAVAAFVAFRQRA